jgi:hypothetical protein
MGLPFDINVSTISWIDKTLMSSFSPMPNPLAGGDSWVDLLCYGMSHTANPEPPKIFHGDKYKSGTTLGMQYRSLTTYSLQLQTTADGKFDSVRRLPNSDAVLDPGYTPPFDSSWELWKGILGTAFVGFDPTLPSMMHSEATTYNAGEKSSLSGIVLPGSDWQNRGITPLPYSSIKVDQDAVILGHSLIKFRVGKRGDYIGVVGIGTPTHLPWVWCEAILAYSNNNLILYGAGSAFPSHAFYVGDEQQASIDLTTNRVKLKNIFSSGLPAITNWAPVFGDFSGRSIVVGINDQTSTMETNWKIVTQQPFTALANEKGVRRVIPLTSLKCWQ